MPNTISANRSRSISTTRPKPSIGAGRKRWRSIRRCCTPVVRTHPVTGKQALFVNEGFTTRIVEVSEKESAALLNFLFAHVTKPEFQVRWRWQPNDVAIWDNRVTQHYANADYLPQRRIMHRATILGDKPYYRAG
ncbi:alpha-ketoglutarate-dependent taurine dioxygenase [Klebsiella pneumoniae subsp. ozaenae]|uniref:Alpha-ketoglutarate-dependent taurine dioxygenase n=1 Tax=Klebsiella pneumoniae subsp. ozaenae TaxID=574 RepID=A0A378BZW0_KLEPO|nr:alpha-ketoglutarate-dependent taurine dioxygenase [Klebsiella pneumoniae subsp. ozaenae]